MTICGPALRAARPRKGPSCWWSGWTHRRSLARSCCAGPRTGPGSGGGARRARQGPKPTRPRGGRPAARRGTGCARRPAGPEGGGVGPGGEGGGVGGEGGGGGGGRDYGAGAAGWADRGAGWGGGGGGLAGGAW